MFVVSREAFGQVSRLSPTNLVPLLDSTETEAGNQILKYKDQDSSTFMTFVSLPEQVCIGSSSVPGVKYGVFTNCWIKEGTHMGPFTGHILRKDEIDFKQDNNFMWEVSDWILCLTKQILSYASRELHQIKTILP